MRMQHRSPPRSLNHDPASGAGSWALAAITTTPRGFNVEGVDGEVEGEGRGMTACRLGGSPEGPLQR